MAYISRDPFARTELHRHVERDQSAITRGCCWCGNLNRAGNLYRYETESDGGRNYGRGNPFCSISCMRAYCEL